MLVLSDILRYNITQKSKGCNATSGSGFSQFSKIAYAVGYNAVYNQIQMKTPNNFLHVCLIAVQPGVSMTTGLL